jgi:hypothetical protein
MSERTFRKHNNSLHLLQIQAPTLNVPALQRSVSSRVSVRVRALQVNRSKGPRDMFQPRLCRQHRRPAKLLIQIDPKGHSEIHGGDLVDHLPQGRVIARRLSRTLEGIGSGGSSKAAGSGPFLVKKCSTKLISLQVPRSSYTGRH